MTSALDQPLPAGDDPWAVSARPPVPGVALAGPATRCPPPASWMFRAAHAAARDAVHQPLDPASSAPTSRVPSCLEVHSARARPRPP
jgi:ethanolamine ammonia-lyase small subunit